MFSCFLTKKLTIRSPMIGEENIPEIIQSIHFYSAISAISCEVITNIHREEKWNGHVFTLFFYSFYTKAPIQVPTSKMLSTGTLLIRISKQ